MGCDIHMFCEVRKDGKWRPFTAAERAAALPESWFVGHCRKQLEEAKAKGLDGEAIARFEKNYRDALHEWNTGQERDYDAEKGADGEIPWKNSTCEVEVDRNYDLFAMLADVRNGRGFAGIETGEGFLPICDPKGLPDDVSEPVREASDRWGVDGHSHSWHTLADLQAYFAVERKTRHYGMVSLDEYKVFKEKGQPESWCGDVSGGSIQKVTPTEMDRIITGTLAVPGGKTPFTRVTWEESYANSARGFIDTVMPGLAKLGAPEDVRVVFWFDN